MDAPQQPASNNQSIVLILISGLLISALAFIAGITFFDGANDFTTDDGFRPPAHLGELDLPRHLTETPWEQLVEPDRHFLRTGCPAYEEPLRETDGTIVVGEDGHSVCES